MDDPHTHVIAMYVEACAARRPSSLRRAAHARQASRIIMLHPGKSSKAQESAATHTGAMAGDYQLMKAKLAREGVIFADTLEELGDITEIALRCPARRAPTWRCSAKAAPCAALRSTSPRISGST